MPRKAKNKPASNDTAAFKPSGDMECFLALMNQNCQIVSQFMVMELMTITQGKWEQVLMDLLTMKFVKVDEPTTTGLSSAVPIKVDNNANDISDDELTPVEDLTNTIAYFGKWFQSNNIPNNVCSRLIDNIRQLAMMFNLIPAPHRCPPSPLPCICPHQDNATPCQCLHTDDVLTPPPCVWPHCDDEDIPMEPITPTCVFSEAALQTPIPSHEVSTPPPPPAAVASIPPAGP
ncbi:hypothetical protein P691DRAFT_766584 [Macrolepiota fuliginosa MF-IS2]|uniref:Uncharacterized protein n=1 Tax=Macrolepiota fuliginosa MF-IS2 TaxID=1400762 RepID=A0A9P5X0R9_9AGAR|nr:hypothetical protein P691DRAFT_766584 [Macrolepiota fuliginosa MF-IS2]